MNLKSNSYWLFGGQFILLLILAGMLFTRSTLAIFPYSILLVSYLFGKKTLISPMVYLTIPWSFMIIMQMSNFIVYKNTVKLIPFLYLIACLLIIYLGYFVGGKLVLSNRFRLKYDNKNSPDNEMQSERVIIQIIHTMCFISILGSLLTIYDLIFISVIDVSSLSALRDSYVAKESTIFSQIGNTISWACLSSIPTFFFCRRNCTSWLWKLIWVISIILYIVQNMLSAGRQVVFSITIMLLVCFTIKLYLHPKIEQTHNNKIRKETKKLKRIIFSFAIIAIAYMLYIASNRNNENISTTKIGVLQFYFGFDFCPWMQKILALLPSGLADGIAEAFVYFTHQINGFSTFWDIPKIGPFLGLYSMPFLDRRLAFLHLSSFSMNDKMEYVRNYMRSQGSMPVGWRTAFSYYLFDYGLIGTLFFCFILGLIARKIYINFRNRRTFFSALLLIQVCVYMFYTVMMPATCETGLLFMLIFGFIMNSLEKRHSCLRYNIS